MNVDENGRMRTSNVENKDIVRTNVDLQLNYKEASPSYVKATTDATYNYVWNSNRITKR